MASYIISRYVVSENALIIFDKHFIYLHVDDVVVAVVVNVTNSKFKINHSELFLISNFLSS